MLRSDFHMHSNFSGDSKAALGHMVHGAVAKGLNTICFTDHNDPFFPYREGEEGMFDLDTDRYLESLLQTAELYRDKIDIRHGVEIGIQTHIYKELSEYIRKYPFDFVIGSSHLCLGTDPYYPAFWEDRSLKDGLTVYLEDIHQNVHNFTDYDVYGHLDYIVRYAPGKNKDFRFADYADILEDILKTIIDKGKGIEVNSAGFRQGLGAPNPCADILKLYRSLGGEILTTGSDAHKPEDIASDFTQTEALIQSCGFKYYTVFKNRQPEFIKID
ncbi:MAG: histidinol-phosphatase HisJ family protein [Lachnospiraceae bacterium]|nr:histidinol-phosphatase HisJ family protein [Lachnospiraceae bacterium]